MDAQVDSTGCPHLCSADNTLTAVAGARSTHRPQLAKAVFHAVFQQDSVHVCILRGGGQLGCWQSTTGVLTAVGRRRDGISNAVFKRNLVKVKGPPAPRPPCLVNEPGRMLTPPGTSRLCPQTCRTRTPSTAASWTRCAMPPCCLCDLLQRGGPVGGRERRGENKQGGETLPTAGHQALACGTNETTCAR